MGRFATAALPTPIGMAISEACARTFFTRASTACTATDNRAVDAYRDRMLESFAPLRASRSPHGIFASACLDHCQSGSGWSFVKVGAGGSKLLLREAARRWFFEGATVKVVDQQRLSHNPTCGCPCAQDTEEVSGS